MLIPCFRYIPAEQTFQIICVRLLRVSLLIPELRPLPTSTTLYQTFDTRNPARQTRVRVSRTKACAHHTRPFQEVGVQLAGLGLCVISFCFALLRFILFVRLCIFVSFRYRSFFYLSLPPLSLTSFLCVPFPSFLPIFHFPFFEANYLC